MADEMFEKVWHSLLPRQLVTDKLSSRIKNNIVTPPDAPIPDCQTCGACCQAPIAVGVRHTESVSPELYWDITTESENGEIVVDRYLRRNGETLSCAALEGAIGGHVVCTIYEDRPLMCRQFEAGSDKCHELRRAYGIEPFLTLDEMSAAQKKLDEPSTEINPSEVIASAEIKEDPETGLRTITALMRDRSLRQLHTYDPSIETWMQFEFDGYKLTEAQDLIETRRGGLERASH